MELLSCCYTSAYDTHVSKYMYTMFMQRVSSQQIGFPVGHIKVKATETKSSALNQTMMGGAVKTVLKSVKLTSLNNMRSTPPHLQQVIMPLHHLYSNLLLPLTLEIQILVWQ